MALSQWQLARQRDFSGGETLAQLPEKIGRNQLIRVENAIISPEGLLTESWQLDQPLFENVSGGVVIVPVPESNLFTVYAESGNDIISFTFDPASPTPYDMDNAESYEGYQNTTFENPVTVLGISHGTPFLGKNYCCASTSLYVLGELIVAPEAVEFGTVQNTSLSQTTITITNDSGEVVTLTSAYMSGDDTSRFGCTGTFPQTLAPSGTYTFDVTFNPLDSGVYAATVNISNTLGVLQVQLTGTSSAMLTSTSAAHAYGTKHIGVVTPGDITTVTNSGSLPMTVTAINLGGDDPGAFAVVDAMPATVPAGDSKSFAVAFTPYAARPFWATATIKTSVGDIAAITLSGTGAVLMAAVPASIAGYGIQDAQATLYATTIHNYSGTDSFTITGIQQQAALWSDIWSMPTLPCVVPPGGTANIVLRYIYPYHGYKTTGNLVVTTSWGVINIPITLGGAT